MKREIKFRGWHPSLEEMFFFDMWIPLETECSMGNSYYTKNMEIMQYTGLKDKNGKDIYECDIVKTIHGICEVKYRGAGFCFKLNETTYLPLYELESLLSEVIGNIYENQELIK